MNIHIPYLEDILLLCALIFPGSINAMLPKSKGKNAFAISTIMNITVHIILIILIVIVKREQFLFLNFPSWFFYPIAIAAGFSCIVFEYYIGALQIFIKEGKFPKGIRVHSFYTSKMKIMDFLLIIVLVIVEELILRQALFTILLLSIKLNLWIVITVSAFIYGLNHLFFGIKTFPQKLISGFIYTCLFYFSGMSIIVPIIAHTVQNLSLALMSRSGGKNANAAASV